MFYYKNSVDKLAFIKRIEIINVIWIKSLRIVDIIIN